MKKLICACVMCICMSSSICNAGQYIRIYNGQNNEVLLNTIYLAKVRLDGVYIHFICSEIQNESIKYDTRENAEKAFSAIFKELNGIQYEN